MLINEQQFWYGSGRKGMIFKDRTRQRKREKERKKERNNTSDRVGENKKAIEK